MHLDCRRNTNNEGEKARLKEERERERERERKHFVICVFDGGKVRGYPWPIELSNAAFIKSNWGDSKGSKSECRT